MNNALRVLAAECIKWNIFGFNHSLQGKFIKEKDIQHTMFHCCILVYETSMESIAIYQQQKQKFDMV